MADLSVLKAELKAWEKAFKAKHGREAKKEDIKLDAEIADKYKVYNKSRKPPPASGPSSSTASTSADPSSSSKQPPPPSKPSPSASKPGPSQTKRSSRSSPPPPAPNSARSNRSAPYSTPSKPVASPFASTTPSRAKRPPSASSAQGTNPFLASAPPRTPSSESTSKPATPSSASASASFHFAPSPSKLLSLISAHSSTGVPNDAASLRGTPGWTPRTKARKRLRGEDVGGETPQKKGRKSFGVATLGEPSGPSSKGDLIEEEEDEDDEEMLGPSPVKEDEKGVREWFGSKRVLAEDSEEDSGDDDSGGLSRRLPPLKRNSLSSNGTSSSVADIKGKGRAFFGAGKMVELSAAAAARQAAASALEDPAIASSTTSRNGKTGSGSASNPFIFSTTPSWTDAPSVSTPNDGDPAKEGDAAKHSDGSSPPPEKKTKANAKKNARKAGPSAPRLTAAKKAKAETALETLKGIIGSDEEDEDEEGGSGMGLGVEVGVKIVRGRHLLGRGRPADEGKGKGRESPAKPVRTAAGHDSMDEQDGAEAEMVDAWDSQDDQDLFAEAFYSPSKPKVDVSKPRTLYGLPDEHASASPEPESPPSADSADEDADGEDDAETETARLAASPPPKVHPKVELPPHLLSLLSLRSPESQAAKLRARRAQTFQDIFAGPAPTPPPPPPPAPVPTRRKGKGKEPEKEKPAPLPVILPRRNVLGVGKKRADAGGEVWGIGDEVVVGGDEDEDWASEVEGWKEGGGWGERDEEDW